MKITNKLIVALDVDDASSANILINQLGDDVDFYKVGFQLLMSGNYFDVIKNLKKRNKKVFVDLKLFDIPRTIYHAVKNLNKYKPDFISVHGNDDMIESALDATNGSKILSVTCLTSLDKYDIEDLGFNCDIEDLVLSRAKRSLLLGCQGIVCSGNESKLIKQQFNDKLIVVVPGIQPVNNIESDQKRSSDIDNIKNDCDHIVVGRYITESNDPVKMVNNILKGLKS